MGRRRTTKCRWTQPMSMRVRRYGPAHLGHISGLLVAHDESRWFRLWSGLWPVPTNGVRGVLAGRVQLDLLWGSEAGQGEQPMETMRPAENRHGAAGEPSKSEQGAGLPHAAAASLVPHWKSRKIRAVSINGAFRLFLLPAHRRHPRNRC
ncbi:unnamed protein product [Rangifer tarandus platyrhynchus]|uniref:Uncharacterized protein n=2 Tax=Rangifer tarandus platyrhynchus TaxID=3082113 RepID=A0ABN8Z509_RANTA|nr:unnamed protein product [Rangifer tarandus platyrhynchus]CAI9704483.1 unnamed protein product [Rangifer tarandus platyrhynchus]